MAIPVIERYSQTSPYHDINVTDYGYIRVLRFTRNRQSSMYLDAPFETDFEYPGYFHISVAIKPDATRTLAIGLGGATVVKRMWRDYPAMSIDAVELDPVVVDVAWRFFELPEDERIRVFTDDGRAFLEMCTDTYDIVLVDAFDEDRVPRPLTTEEFMRTLRDRLSADGVAAYNFIGMARGERSKPFRSLYRTMRNVWRNVWVFVVNDGVESEATNLMLFATDADLTADELCERIGDRVGGLVTVPAFELFGEDLFRGEIRLGDVPLILDPVKGKPGRRRATGGTALPFR
jgi:spermidine synthase